MDDKQILDLINNKKTREKGYRLLVSLTKEKLYWQIRRMLSSHEDTDDLIQEVYIKIFRNISSFKQEASLQTWIYRIAYNETINFIKSKSQQKIKNDVSLDEVKEKASSISLQADSYMINELMEKAIQSLPDRQRAVFVLRYYDRMPFKEMEKVMQITESSLKTSYHIAEKKIKEILLNSSLNF